MGLTSLLEVSCQQIPAIDFNTGIAVDTRYLNAPPVEAHPQPSFNPSSLFTLPTELRAMVIAELVRSTISSATLDPTTALPFTFPRDSTQFAKTKLQTNRKKQVPSKPQLQLPLHQTHESWLTSLTTLRSLIAFKLESAAHIFNSIGQLGKGGPAKYSKIKCSRTSAWLDRQRDDTMSELLYAVKSQLCESHGVYLMRSSESELRVFRKRPGFGRDLWASAPGPEGNGVAVAAWKRLYGGKSDRR